VNTSGLRRQHYAEAGETYSTRAVSSPSMRAISMSAADLVERSAEGRLGTAEAVERSLQRELVRLGIPGRRDAGADAGHVPKLKEMGIKWVTLDDRCSMSMVTGIRARILFPEIPLRR